MSHPLLSRLTETLGIPLLDEAGFDRHVQAQPWSMLFFPGDPNRFPETLDVAVILPELCKAFPYLEAAVISRDFERTLQGRYRLTAWPSLVFLRRGRYLDHLSQVLSWEEYLTRIPLILVCEPQEGEGVRIPLLQLVPPTPAAHKDDGMTGDTPLFTLAMGPGSRAGEDALDYLPMPQAMRTFEQPILPELEEIGDNLEVLAVLSRLQTMLVACQVEDLGRVIPLQGLSERGLTLLHQILGEGEVAVQIRGDEPARIQKTVLAGVWWVIQFDARGGTIRQWLEVTAIPALVPRLGFAGARWPQPEAGSLPRDLHNAVPVLRELLDVARRHAESPRACAHVLNLSLLPFSAEDHRFLAEQLGEGPVLLLSRGYGNCRIASTATPGIWRVQYFNSSDLLILDTLEVTSVPQAACAVQEDIKDSCERLGAMREVLA